MPKIFSQNVCDGLAFLANANELANGCPVLFDQSTFPLLEIRVNIHFIRGADFNESFYPGNVGDNNPWNGNAMARRIVDYWLSTQYWPNLLAHPNVNQPSLIGDSRIRMELYSEVNTPNDQWGGIFYWDDEADVILSPYDNTLNIIIYSDDPGDTNPKTMDLPDDPNTIECDPVFRGASAIACGIGTLCNSMELYSLGNNIRYKCNPTDNNDVYSSGAARNIMHEFGHIAGLCHSFAPNNPCSDVNPFIECNGTAPDGGGGSCGGDHDDDCSADGPHTNNMMGYGTQLRSLTPCQWTTMYTYLYEDESAFVNITADGDCDVVLPGQSSGTVIIPTGVNEVYDETVFMFDDIIIEPTASLRVSCLLLMAENKTITVKRGGKLIVDGATIVNMEPDKFWEGIFVEGNSNEIQPEPSLLPPNPSEANLSGAVILNNANIIGANTAISTHRYDASWDADFWGGLIAASRTNFTNNRRAVEFMAYQLFTGSFPDNSLVPNKSIFEECRFEEIGEFRENTMGVTIWACNNITFKACQFENLDRSGIYGINSGFNVVNTTITNNRETIFKNIRRPIELFSTYTNGSYNVNIEQTLFIRDDNASVADDDVTHISVHASSELSDVRVSDCLFKDGRRGIWIDGPSGYGLVSNVFDGTDFPFRVENTGNNPSEIKCNIFYDASTLFHTRILGSNSGLLYRYNDAGNTPPTFFFSIWFTGTADILGTINPEQGSTVDPARNCFAEAGALFAATPTTQQFNYHVNENLLPPYQECVLLPVQNNPNGNNFNVAFSSVTLNNVIPIDCIYELNQFLKPNEEDKGQFDNTRQDIAYYHNLQNNAELSANEQTTYNAIQNQYNELLGTILGGYQYSGDFAEMESFLLNDALSTEYSQRSLLSTYIEQKDWGKATVSLNNLATTSSEEQAYKDIMQINLAAAQQQYEGYSLSVAESAQLHQIADGVTPSRSYARALLAFYEEASYDPDEEMPILSSALQSESDTPPNFIRSYPTPAKDVLMVQLSQEELENSNQSTIRCRIISLDGRVVFYQNTLKAIRNKLEISSIPAGMHLLELQLPSGETEYQKIIIH